MAVSSSALPVVGPLALFQSPQRSPVISSFPFAQPLGHGAVPPVFLPTFLGVLCSPRLPSACVRPGERPGQRGLLPGHSGGTRASCLLRLLLPAAGRTAGQWQEYGPCVALFTSLMGPKVGPSRGFWGIGRHQVESFHAQRKTEHWLSSGQTLPRRRSIVHPRCRQKSSEGACLVRPGRGGWLWGRAGVRAGAAIFLAWMAGLL